MIALLVAGLALAQQNSELTGEGRDCQLPAAIYGTAGWANAQQALDTNATTYSAAAFAERLGLDQPQDADGRKVRGLVVWEIDQTYDVARVPTFHGEFGQDFIGPSGCAPEYRVGLRPVDLQATLLAGVFGTEHFGGFFAASQTSGQVADADNIMRAVYFGYLYPIYSTVPLAFYPFFSREYRNGANGFALDAVYGAWFDNRWIMAKGGYTKSSGLFVNVRDHTVGAFFTGVLRPGDGSVPVIRAGVQRFDPAKVGGDGVRNVGMPTVFFRDIPLAQPIGVASLVGVARERLRTTHVALEDVGRLVDVASAFRLRPDADLSELLVGVHSRAYHLREGAEPESPKPYLFLQGGAVTLLEQPSLGVAGGLYPSARFEAGFKGPKATFWVHVQLNDAEQLALYPFARNALSLQYHLEVTRW